MMTTQEAWEIGWQRFKRNHRALLGDGLASGRIAALALGRFESRCAGKEEDERFSSQAPDFAFKTLANCFLAYYGR